jgi:CheY-like chemotaxis protein
VWVLIRGATRAGTSYLETTSHEASRHNETYGHITGQKSHFAKFEGEAVSGDRWAQLADVDVPVNLVLLVEDDPDSAATSKLILERHGMKVKIAKDGGQAQAAFVMNKPDFVILDLILPGESGFEICDRLKHSDDSIPVLIFSAIDSDESRALANRVGADEYLTKPVAPDKLVETIYRVAKAVWSKSREPESKSQERIRFSCICGKKFRVSSAHKGRSMNCPQCGEPMTVPS